MRVIDRIAENRFQQMGVEIHDWKRLRDLVEAQVRALFQAVNLDLMSPSINTLEQPDGLSFTFMGYTFFMWVEGQYHEGVHRMQIKPPEWGRLCNFTYNSRTGVVNSADWGLPCLRGLFPVLNGLLEPEGREKTPDIQRGPARVNSEELVELTRQVSALRDAAKASIPLSPVSFFDGKAAAFVEVLDIIKTLTEAP